MADVDSTSYVDGVETVVAIKADGLHRIATHHKHLHGSAWHGDLFEITLAYVISHVTVDNENSRSNAKDAVMAFVEYAQDRSPLGKPEGIMAQVDSKFYDIFEDVGFRLVSQTMCLTRERIASMHLTWPQVGADSHCQTVHTRCHQ